MTDSFDNGFWWGVTFVLAVLFVREVLLTIVRA